MITCDIVLCKVPLDFKNQRSFENVVEQKKWFNQRIKHTHTNCRLSDDCYNKIQINEYIDSLNNSNYGYFDRMYGDTVKRFYFFILGFTPISQRCTELDILIDSFQTWYFDIEYRNCFIEREHVKDDTIGKHTIPESFELGDYITQSKKEVDYLKGLPVFILAYANPESIGGGIFGSNYSGLQYRCFSFGSFQSLSDFIEKLCKEGKDDCINSIFTYPSNFLQECIPGGTIPSDVNISSLPDCLTKDISIDDMLQSFSFNGESYTPYNNKLFTYPYNFCTIKNSSGGNVVLKYELWNGKLLRLQSVLSPNATFSLTPLNYDGKAFAIDDSITMNDFGLCSWNNDNFNNWYAQNKAILNNQSRLAENNYNSVNAINENNLDLGKLTSSLNFLQGNLASVFSGNMMAGLYGGVNTLNSSAQTVTNYQNSNIENSNNYFNQISSLMSQVDSAKVQPNTCKGSTTCSLDLARDTATFFIEQTSIKPEYARIIDMFFQMFGYKVNCVKKVDIKSRKHWNYIKTVGSNIGGEIPFNDIKNINDLFDNGLTIWHDDDFFNYNRKN